MLPEEFAAERWSRLRQADEELRPSIRSALRLHGEGDENWMDALVGDLSALWLEIFDAEAPEGNRGLALARFRRELRTSLAKTGRHAELDEAQVNRLTFWLSGYVTNSAQVAAGFARGVRYKRWISMRDDDVRETHVKTDGQIVPIGGTFNVGGHRLQYPGEPVGPPEVWINCRCLAQPAARDGEAMSATTYTIGPEDEVDEENPDIVVGEKSTVTAAASEIPESDEPPQFPEDEGDLVPDEPEDDEDLITEMPVHGVSIVEGRATGDGRGFRNGALTFDDVPQPLGYEFEHGHGAENSRVAIVGRIDEIFRKAIDDNTSEIRWRGAIILSKEYASQAIESIVDGSYNGSSVIIDDVTVDVEELKEQMRERLEREDEGGLDVVDEFIGDGTTQVTWISAARQRRLDMVPTGAFIESRIGLGHAFDDELTDEDREALAACGCMDAAVVDLSDDPDENLRALAEAEDGAYREIDTEERKRLAKEGKALPDGSFPIANVEDLRNAIQAIGRASDPDAAKAHIKKRARELGQEELIPEGWGIVGAWDGQSGSPASSTTDRETTSAGSGRGTAMARGTGESLSPPASVGPRTASSMSGASAPSRTGSSSTISAGTGDASTRGTASPSPTPRTSPAATAAMAGRGGSAAQDFTTSPTPTTGSRQGAGSAPVVPAGTQSDGVSNVGMLSAAIGSDFAPQTHDAPGWITHPVPTARIRRYWVRGKGAAKIRWGAPGDFNRCRLQLAKYVKNPDWLAGLCANMHYEALGFWPSTHGKAVRGGGAATFRLAASGATVYDASLFAEPEADHAYPVRIDRDTRRIYGFLAEWGVCHVGIEGVCRETPASTNEYAYFRKGTVETTAGTQRVGTLTYGIGHASPRLRAAAATAHYDQTDAVRAYVNMGENSYGIWYSGVLAPWVGDAEIDAILAIGAFSGDWRDWGQGSLDLIAAVCVSTPGFQLAASGGRTTALIAAGALAPEPPSRTVEFTLKMDADTVAGIARAAVAEYRHLERREQVLTPVRQNIRTKALAAARAKIEEKR